MDRKKVKKWIKWLVGLGLLVFILNYGFETYSRLALEKLITTMSGLRTRIVDFNIGVVSSDVEIKDLFIFNPSHFKERRMIDIPRIYIDFDIPALFKKELNFKKLELDLREYTVVRLDKGDSNLHHLRVVKDGILDPFRIETIIEIGHDFNFEVVDLKIGKVVFIDYYRNERGRRREFQLNLHHRLYNVDSIESLHRIILFDAIVSTGINKILNLNLTSITKPVSGILRGAATITGKLLPFPK